MEAIRKVIHLDMDAFFASVEQRDNPTLRGKPVAVGGAPEGRGVVAAASYEARAFGVHSALPTRLAVERCPDLVVVPPRFEVYRSISKKLREIFGSFTELVEPLALDEAYLEVTENKRANPSATSLARELKLQVFGETGLTSSAGVSVNKFIAKVASGLNKPDGLTVVPPGQIEEFLRALPIEKFYGVGPKTAQRMGSCGIRTGEDLRRWDEAALVKVFGKLGATLYRLVRGEDSRPVFPRRTRKSVGAERTFSTDLLHGSEIFKALREIARGALERLESGGWLAHTVTVKVRLEDFSTVTRQSSFTVPSCCLADFVDPIRHLYFAANPGGRPVRLLGISFSGLTEKAGYRQLSLNLTSLSQTRESSQ